jgi:hypothetical protein
MHDEDENKKGAPPAAAGRERTPLSAILISSLATTVLITVIIAGSLYIYRLFPDLRAGSLQEELLSWGVILLGGGACLAVLLLGAQLRRWLAARAAKTHRILDK